MKIKLIKKSQFFPLMICSTFLLVGCSGDSSSDNGNSEPVAQVETVIASNDSPTPNLNDSSTISWYVPAVSATWQWQLSGTVNTTYDVDIYDIDLFDSPISLIQELQASGKKVICYFSAGSYEEWRDDADSFLESDLGKALDGWEGERWLDVRSSNVRAIMESRLDLAKDKGCDAVEPDNMDGYTNNPELDFTAEDQLIYNRFIADAAHERLLGVGLKNDLDQIEDLVTYYDFAVNEQCFEFNECIKLMPFVVDDKAVFTAEYDDLYVNDETTRTALCANASNLNFSTLILPLDLNDEFRLTCQ